MIERVHLLSIIKYMQIIHYIAFGYKIKSAQLSSTLTVDRSLILQEAAFSEALELGVPQDCLFS